MMPGSFASLFGTEAEQVFRDAYRRSVERFGPPKFFLHGFQRLQGRFPGDESSTTPLYLDRLIPAPDAGRALVEITTPSGTSQALLAESDDGLLATADLVDIVECHLAETYHKSPRPITARTPFNYRRFPTGLRNWLHGVLVALRRIMYPQKAKGVWPHWPVETFARRWIEASGIVVSPLPDRRVFVFTHDVDGPEQITFAQKIAAWENANGIRACFFLPAVVLREKAVEVEQIAALGHEIGLHGLTHDNRQLLIDPMHYAAAVETYREELDRFAVAAYRAPSLLTNSALRRALAELFSIDSSIPDTDIYAEAGLHHGCGVLRPYDLDGLREAPITLPLDDRLHTLGEVDPVAFWLTKTKWIHNQRGVAVLCTHANERYYPQGPEAVFDKLLTGLQKQGNVEFFALSQAARPSD